MNKSKSGKRKESKREYQVQTFWLRKCDFFASNAIDYTDCSTSDGLDESMKKRKRELKKLL